MRGCFRFIVNTVVLLFFVALLAAVAAYFYVLPTVDTLLADAVRRDLMLPPSSTVVIKRSSIIDTYQGQVDSFLVESKEAKVEGLVIEDVKLVGTGITFDLPRTLATGQAEISKVDNADLSFRVSEASLEERWGSDLKKKGITDLNVDLDGQNIRVDGNMDLKLAKIKIGAIGNFHVDGSQKIKFKVTDFDLGGNQIGMSLVKSVFSSLTPVINLGQLKIGVGVSRLEAKDGYLEVEAQSVDLAELARAMKEPPPEPEGEDKRDLADKVKDTLDEAGSEIEDFTSNLKEITR
jgi:hypothetical protein